MPASQYIPRMVNLEPMDYRIIRKVMLEKGLSKKGFSAAIRMIIREWSAIQATLPPPNPPNKPPAASR